MAVADQPSGLMDIASSLAQDEIPFKLRCAICNKLAVNAFRLPCCDQGICEPCQVTLPDTCPVCAHTPLSSDLCKPNKALRTTLKAFLRTEEKKREKDRQSATPAAGTATASDTPAPSEQPAAATPAAAPEDQNVMEGKPEIAPFVEPPLEDQPATDPTPVEASEEAVLDAIPETAAEAQPQNGQEDNAPTGTQEATDTAEPNGPGEGDEAADGTTAPSTEPESAQPNGMQLMFPNPMGFNMPGGFPNMGWNGSGDFNPMAQFMSNGMFNPQNPMGMSGMAMDPMAASPGMFGGYGMNMNGMSNGMNNGMNMGMNFDAGQGMYGGWDGSQNNMWNGGQDKFNPSAFASGMSSQYGPASSSSGFGGYNMSHQPNGSYAQMQQPSFSNQDFSNGYYGPGGSGRGNFRGRGRGFTPGGRGRGGFPGSMHANFPNANNAAFQTPTSSSSQQMPSEGAHGDGTSPEDASGAGLKPFEDGQEGPEKDQSQGPPTNHLSTNEITDEITGEAIPPDTPVAEGLPGAADNAQLQGIPTIDSLDQTGAAAMPAGFVSTPGPHMGPGFGRGYMRGPFLGGRGMGFSGAPFGPGPNMPGKPLGQGVEGAPAAPRAMRQGLPNTSVLRQRTQSQGGGTSVPPSRPSEVSQSGTPIDTRDDNRARSRSRSRSRSPSRYQSDTPRRHRHRSPSAHSNVDEYDRRRDRHRRSRRDDKYDDQSTTKDDYRTRSPSLESSRRSTRREKDRDRDRRSGRRSHRSHRNRSRSRSHSRDGDARDADDSLPAIPEENGSGPRDKTGETLEATSRSHRSSGKDRSNRREEERERDRDRDARRRDRDRRDRDRYRERDRDRDRDRDRERHRDRDRDKGKDRERDRERDRKRPRRDRTGSPADSDYSTRHHSRRLKRSRDDQDDHHHPPPSSSAKPDDDNQRPEKDPHTLEREARDRERLLREQQRRQAMHSENGTGGGTSHRHLRDKDRGQERDRDRDRDRDHHKSSRRRGDSRQDRLTGGRRLSYKYEDEESDAARAARVEKEREADRWA